MTTIYWLLSAFGMFLCGGTTMYCILTLKREDYEDTTMPLRELPQDPSEPKQLSYRPHRW